MLAQTAVVLLLSCICAGCIRCSWSFVFQGTRGYLMNCNRWSVVINTMNSLYQSSLSTNTEQLTERTWQHVQMHSRFLAIWYRHLYWSSRVSSYLISSPVLIINLMLPKCWSDRWALIYEYKVRGGPILDTWIIMLRYASMLGPWMTSIPSKL